MWKDAEKGLEPYSESLYHNFEHIKSAADS